MFAGGLVFANPIVLLGLAALPVIWWLLRFTPPRPQQEVFPPTRILMRLENATETPAQSPWWLTLLRLALATCVILAMAQPVLNPNEKILSGDGPVLLIVDDGWTSAGNWDNQIQTATQVLDDAANEGRSVALLSTTRRASWSGNTMLAEEAAALLAAASARSVRPDREWAARQIANLPEPLTNGDMVYLSDGLTDEGFVALGNAIETTGANGALFTASPDNVVAIETVRNEPTMMIGSVTKADRSGLGSVSVLGKDRKGLVIARTVASFSAGKNRARFEFSEPVELRNQIARLEIAEAQNAAAVQLLDENNRRRLVGLLAGDNRYQAQPLLSPLYYVSKALGPFADLRRSQATTTTQAIDDLLNQGVNALILSDIGTLPEATANTLESWVSRGGLVIRFAGPRLGAAEEHTLLPVDIRPGDRELGGALSWETPKNLAEFEPDSPYFGIASPGDVTVKKQLMALQETDLEEKTWARLEDGTPLVTAEALGSGMLVLFHVSSDNEWSNLPISATFVEMLRRTVNLASGNRSVLESNAPSQSLPPLRLLNGHGSMSEPDGSTKPLILEKGRSGKASYDIPPGLYGTEDGFVALNLVEEETVLSSLEANDLPGNLEVRNYQTGNQIGLTDWLLFVAALLFALDCLAVAWMSGSLRRLFRKPAIAGALFTGLLATGFLASPDTARAQSADIDYGPTLSTRIAYVETGVPDVDEITLAGMRGLTQYLISRTALEPGPPVGLDVESDELAFYSLIYWPIDERAELPTDQAIARIDAFMKNGGSILFDTRDEAVGVLGGTSGSPSARRLQQLLADLDIPALEPVPENHVLTKSFYLLDTFPGRFAGGDLWVEASRTGTEDQNRIVSRGDGVSSIMITSNDFAGAWAVDDEYHPLLPTVPGDPLQRNYAFRVGVNLMMYALTGNYKSDQVHLPTIIERLGQ